MKTTAKTTKWCADVQQHSIVCYSARDLGLHSRINPSKITLQFQQRLLLYTRYIGSDSRPEQRPLSVAKMTTTSFPHHPHHAANEMDSQKESFGPLSWVSNSKSMCNYDNNKEVQPTLTEIRDLYTTLNWSESTSCFARCHLGFKNVYKWYWVN